MSSPIVSVDAPARLHFGLLDLRGALGRMFGGVGAPAPELRVCISASLADVVTAEGAGADRASEFARRFLAHYGIESGAHITVERAIPAHAGLGSGTQLALSVGRALAELYGMTVAAPELARAVGRAQRSAVGTWTFAGGGFVLEGGRRGGDDGAGPLLARLPFPAAWRCIVAVPGGRTGVSGAAEARAFASLPLPPQHEVERVSHLVLMAMLPALVEGDLETFGRALTMVQEINGSWFSSAQGGIYAGGSTTDLIHRMREWGAAGVGQSSWGPAAYAVVGGDSAAHALAERVRESLGRGGTVHVGPFPTHGAVVTRDRR